MSFPTRAALSYDGLPITCDEIGNPFRYRGYYYDKDLGWYYLQTRYYNPQWGRFINADGLAYLGANGDLQAYSLFSYCSNNPIAYVDPTGNFIWSGLACFAFEAQNLNSGINF